jgi:hypothetical protein
MNSKLMGVLVVAALALGAGAWLFDTDTDTDTLADSSAPAFAAAAGMPAAVAASPGFAVTTAGAAPAIATPAALGASEGARLVEPHARGVFFDRRPLQAQVQQVAAAGRPDADRLQPTQLVDSAGFGQPMTVMTLDMPVGWTGSGGVDWDRSVDCHFNAARLRWSAASPDGLYGIAVMPALAWQLQSRPIDPFDPCPAAPMASIRDYLEFVAGNARPNVRVLSYRDRPDLVQLLSQGANPTGSSYQAGELLIGYSLQGHEMRETLVSALQLMPMAPGGILAMSHIVLGVRAPDGHLDFAFAERIRSSLQRQPEWAAQHQQWAMAKMQQVQQRTSASIADWHERRMSEITMAGMTARHHIRMDTIQQIGQINTQIVASRAGTDARMHENFKDMVQEVQPWRDPSSGQQVDLSIHYSNAWQLDDGRQFLTNDHSFDPGRDLGIAGRRLEPVR